MKNQSAKKRGDDDDGSVISIDRLSELPQPILHDILSLLSQKEAVQTSVLSKTWRYLWCARPKLEFSEGSLPWKGKLIHAVDKTLKRYHDQNLSIQEFILDVPGVQTGICSYLEKWISMLISRGGVKTLNLKFVSASYVLPQVVFLIESLQELKLENCGLNKFCSAEKVMLKNLQTLRLRNVSIEEETFEKIMSSCPLIQCLVIHQCKGLRTIKVSDAHNLRNFDCDNNYVINHERPVWHLHKTVCPNIEIGAPTTLQSIRIGDSYSKLDGHHVWYWHDDNKFFPNLKSVHMYNVRLPTESFDIFSSYNSPFLEVLELYDCYGFNEIELSNSSIKRLIFDMCPIKSAAIDAPNILYLKLSFQDLPSPLSFTKNSSCDWKSDISVRCYLHSYNGNVLPTWSVKLNVLLKALLQSQITLDIGCSCSTNMIVGDTFDEGFNEPVVIEHLSLSGSVFPDLINYLFHNIFRPRYVNDTQIKWKNEGKEIGRESLCKVLLQEIEKMDCLWLQNLEDISIEELKDADDDDAEEWLNFLESSSSNKKNRLRLKWKE